MLTQPLQDLNKETPLLMVPSIKIERRVDTWVIKVVLHQLGAGDFSVSIDRAVSISLRTNPIDPLVVAARHAYAARQRRPAWRGSRAHVLVGRMDHTPCATAITRAPEAHKWGGKLLDTH